MVPEKSGCAPSRGGRGWVRSGSAGTLLLCPRTSVMSSRWVKRLLSSAPDRVPAVCKAQSLPYVGRRRSVVSALGSSFERPRWAATRNASTTSQATVASKRLAVGHDAQKTKDMLSAESLLLYLPFPNAEIQWTLIQHCADPRRQRTKSIEWSTHPIPTL